MSFHIHRRGLRPDRSDDKVAGIRCGAWHLGITTIFVSLVVVPLSLWASRMGVAGTNVRPLIAIQEIGRRSVCLSVKRSWALLFRSGEKKGVAPRLEPPEPGAQLNKSGKLR